MTITPDNAPSHGSEVTREFAGIRFQSLRDIDIPFQEALIKQLPKEVARVRSYQDALNAFHAYDTIPEGYTAIRKLTHAGNPPIWHDDIRPDDMIFIRTSLERSFGFFPQALVEGPAISQQLSHEYPAGFLLVSAPTEGPDTTAGAMCMLASRILIGKLFDERSDPAIINQFRATYPNIPNAFSESIILLRRLDTQIKPPQVKKVEVPVPEEELISV